MNKKIAIAIDGPSGAGKSTISKVIAKELGIMYLDTGALFRALAYEALEQGVNPKSAEEVNVFLKQANLDIKFENNEQRVFMNGKDVTPFIRTEQISIAASDISVHPELREYILLKERELSERESFILDGRDIGTVVLPNADVKIFLTASAEQRAMRRLIDLQNANQEASYEQVLEDIKKRDKQDSSRATAPTKQAEDAVLVDSSDLTLEETIQEIKTIILDKISD